MTEIQIINRTSNLQLLGVQLSLLRASRVRPGRVYSNRTLLAGFVWPRELKDGSWMWDEEGRTGRG